MSQLSEPLNAAHNKADFSCGNELLDRYFELQANQDVKRKLAACFVVMDKESQLIKGFYTLSNSSIPLDYIPEAIKMKLPKSYASIPTTLLGRLAIDTRFQGQGFGKLVLIDALKRCHEIAKTIGSFAVVVDPIDLSAEGFYKQYGFIKLSDSGKMFLPMKTINQLFQ